MEGFCASVEVARKCNILVKHDTYPDYITDAKVEWRSA